MGNGVPKGMAYSSCKCEGVVMDVVQSTRKVRVGIYNLNNKKKQQGKTTRINLVVLEKGRLVEMQAQGESEDGDDDEATVTAGEVMMDFPNHFVAAGSNLRVGERPCALPSHAMLVASKLYFVIPMERLYRPFSYSRKGLNDGGGGDGLSTSNRESEWRSSSCVVGRPSPFTGNWRPRLHTIAETL